MSDARTNAPKIRFRGFTEDWEQRELGKHLVPYNEVTTENNQYPVFTSSRKGLFFQKDYYDGNQITSEDNTGYNIVPRGYFTYRHMSDDLIFKFNINDIADKGIVSTLYPVFSTTDDLDSKYLQYQLNEGQEFKRFAILQKQGGSRTYMYLSKLKNMIISLPKYDEQIKISTFFKQLDDTIALHQRELDLLKQTKQTYLQKMFPKSGENKPEIRFAGFTDAWEQRKLGDLVDLVIRGVSKPDVPYYRMSVRSHAKGTFRQFVSDPDSVAMDKLFVVRKDDLVVNITFAWEHAIAVVPEENDGLLVSHRFPTYRADGKSDIEFLHYIVSKEEFRRKLEFISPGGAGRNRVLNKKDFLKLKMYVPKLDEQKQIGNFFKQLDDTIALHQRKLDSLKEMKKSLLQQMFV